MHLHCPYVNGNPIPSNAYPVIDNSMVVLHSDKTEIMESARPPQDGNFCLGVWEKTGVRSYYVNHLPWLGNDTANAPSGIGNPTAGAQITERVSLSEDGNKYSGSFTLVAYNLDGIQGCHIHRCSCRNPHHHLNPVQQPVLKRADLRPSHPALTIRAGRGSSVPIRTTGLRLRWEIPRRPSASGILENPRRRIRPLCLENGHLRRRRTGAEHKAVAGLRVC